MKLHQDLWGRYGFQDNPYDTAALTTYSDSFLSLTKAYVGRGMENRESQFLTNILRGKGGNRFVIEGEIGVGKTTFVNYHKYLWEKEAQDRLFTPFEEISFSPHWGRTEFLLNVLSSLTNQLCLIFGQELPNNNNLFQELLLLNKVFVEENSQWQLNIFGVGGGIGKEKQVSIPTLTETKLIQYYKDLIKTILKLDYAGVILHFDNLELLQMDGLAKVQRVFEEIRDLLQIPHVYFIFVAKTGFFNNVISPLERVRSIFFNWPIFLPPLSQEEVLKIFQLRYQLLSTKGMRYIKPIENEVILYLYELYEGKIRLIMDAVNGLITRFLSPFPQTIRLEQAKKLLGEMMLEKIQYSLSEREIEVLLEMVKMEEFSNVDLSQKLDIRKQNMAKYMSKMQKTGYIRMVRKEGKKTIYTCSPDIFYLDTLLYLRRKSSHLPRAGVHIQDPSMNRRQVNFLKTSPSGTQITNIQYAKRFKISRPTASKDLKEMEKKEYLQRLGKGRSTCFEVKSM